jgi:hypothetical protein
MTIKEHFWWVWKTLKKSDINFGQETLTKTLLQQKNPALIRQEETWFS